MYCSHHISIILFVNYHMGLALKAHKKGMTKKKKTRRKGKKKDLCCIGFILQTLYEAILISNILVMSPSFEWTCAPCSSIAFAAMPYPNLNINILPRLFVISHTKRMKEKKSFPPTMYYLSKYGFICLYIVIEDVV